jgi:hypothetical protein
MQNGKCPKCGREIADAACPNCTHVNGAAKPARRDPPPPPELAGLVIERPTPEMIEEARRTFDETEYWAAFREAEKTGWGNIDDLLSELEQKVNGSD